MGHTRRGRFIALSAAGLFIAGAAGVATAQNGIDLAAGSAFASAQVFGLKASGAELLPAHGPYGASDSPSILIKLKDVHLQSACIRLRTIDVPIIGEVTLVGDLRSDRGLSAESFLVDASDIDAELTLDGLTIGPGLLDSGERANSAGIALAGDSLDAPDVDVTILGVSAEKLAIDGIRLSAQRGQGSC